jgi:hypothetical protein
VSTKDAVKLVCRCFAIYFLASLLIELTYFPTYLASFLHYELGTTTIRDPDYWRGYYVLHFLFYLVRLLGLFFAVQWFYRAGPRIEAYLLAPTSSEEEEITGTE